MHVEQPEPVGRFAADGSEPAVGRIIITAGNFDSAYTFGTRIAQEVAVSQPGEEDEEVPRAARKWSGTIW